MVMDTAEPADAGNAPPLSVDLCVIGGGAGGIAVAVAAAALGRSVALIEKNKLGGSLYCGHVPAKVLLAAAKRAHDMRTAWTFGIAPAQPLVDLQALNEQIREVVERVGLNASAARLAGLGVRVIPAAAAFVGKSLVQAGEQRVSARHFVIATGSSPEIPKIEGLEKITYLTDETLFEGIRPMPELLVLGASAQALELAQAFRRLGSSVSVLCEGRVLAAEDSEMATVITSRLQQEGVAIREGVRVVRANLLEGRISLEIDSNGERDTIEGSDLLIAGGRRPNIADLALTTAGITSGADGVVVDRRMRTRNRRVFAIGGAIGTRAASATREHASIVIRRLALGLPARLSAQRVPRVIFTDPQLASVGLSEDDARAKGAKVRVLRAPFYENDLAQSEAAVEGHVKVVTDDGGKILGASIAGTGAAEQIAHWSLALSKGLSVADLALWPIPYPSYSEVSVRAAQRYYATSRGNSFLRKIIALRSKLG